MVAAAVLSGCSYRYDERRFDAAAVDTPSGLVFANLVANGYWIEEDTRVSGAPYTLIIAPRLKQAPSPTCVLAVRSLVLSSAATGDRVASKADWALSAPPTAQNHPDEIQHSAYFSYIPVESAFIASGELEGLKLSYEPHLLHLELQGNPTCPDSIRARFTVDLVLKPHRMKGTSSWWDRLMGV